MNFESTVTVQAPLVTGNHFSKHQKFSRGFCDTFKPAPDTMVQSLNSLNTVDSLLTDTSVKRTPRVGPCLCLFPLFDSL